MRWLPPPATACGQREKQEIELDTVPLVEEANLLLLQPQDELLVAVTSILRFEPLTAVHSTELM